MQGPAVCRVWRRAALLLVAVASLAVLGGCSALRLTYNQGPTLAYWWLDRYADFNSDQTPKVQAALEAWFAWHRPTELPDYAQALAQAQRLAAGDVTAEQVCAQWQPWQQRLQRAYDQAVPALADLVRTLTPEQISHIQRRYTRNNQDAEREYLQASADERHEANVKRSLERAETLYGSLDPPQLKVLDEGLKLSPFDARLWLAERKLRQQEVLRLLREWQASKADAATVQAGLRRLLQDQTSSPRAPYRAYAERLTQANCGLLAQLHNSTTPAQRQSAQATLKGWEGDLRALIAR